MRETWWAGLACVATLCLAGTGRAQAPPPPSTLLPSPAQLVPQGSPIERARPLELPRLAPGLPTPPPPAAAQFAPGASARIGSVAVTGSSLYSPAELDALTRGLTGPAIPFERVEQARLALLQRYRSDGYLLTTVSAALDRGGALRFTVVEGYIADVKLEGDIGPAGTQVLRFLERLKAERPISISRLERYLLLASDVPGVTLRSVLRPSPGDPAAVTLVAQVSRKALDATIVSDNRAFRQTGPEQFFLIAGFNSFTSLGERTELSLLHSYNNTQTFGQASTEFFVGGSGLKVRVYAGFGGTEPSGDLRELGYDGRTRVFGVQGSYPLIRSRAQNLNAIMSLDALESDIRTDTGPPDLFGRPIAVRASFDSTRVLRGGLDYGLLDTWAGGDRDATSTVSFRLSRGLTGLGATQTGDPQAGRTGSKADFFKFNAEITRTQTLLRPWESASLALYGLIAGQVANDVLPSSEKFFLGGIRYNRGFYAGEVTGDNALTATVELQLNTQFEVNALGWQGTIRPQFYAFRDWGETWENQETDLNRRLSSWGGGVRAKLTPNIAVEVEGVQRETRRPNGGTAQVSALKAQAVYWRFLAQF